MKPGAVRQDEEIIQGFCKRIRQDVIRDLEGDPGMEDEEVYRLIDDRIRDLSRRTGLNLADKIRIRYEVFNAIRRLDVLQEFIDDPGITEIMVNGMHPIFIEKNGRLINTGKTFDSKDRLTDIIRQIVSLANRTVNMASPIVDARLADGSRINVVLDPVALNGPILTIRRFAGVPLTGSRLIKEGSISEEALDLLRKLVRSRYNILVSGGTGAGKTTFLNILSEFIPSDERIITIEDSAELAIRGISNLVSLEARNTNSAGCNEISIRDLIKTALRMRPDRIIVGEVRGAESIDMLQAMNVGQDGSMSTIHANSAEDALIRLETMMLLHTGIPLSALKRQVASGIDIIVQLGRLRDGSRRVLEIREVTGCSQENVLTEQIYVFRETGETGGVVEGSLVRAGSIRNTDKLKRAGVDIGNGLQGVQVKQG